MRNHVSRREFCRGLGAATLAAACSESAIASVPWSGADGRLTARPGVPPTEPVAPGIHDLSIGNSDRHCWLAVPEGYTPARAWPLALFFRGAITPAKVYVDAFLPTLNDLGLVLLAPEADGRTWDLVLGGFGPDVTFIDAALAETFRKVRVDASRIACSGFSDGGSYSLSLGLTNGDFLTRIVAYSPGFMVADTRRGQPSFFITHGTLDSVLPISTTSRPIVDELRHLGYPVDYREFEGDHGVSLSLARAAMEWVGRG